MTPDPSERKTRRKRGKLGLALGVVLAAAALLAASGVLSRQRSEAKLAQWTKAQALPTVDVVTPQRGTKDQELVLPADIEAFYEAPIYARVSGYLKDWRQDIGAHVKAGQLLAEIDAPELDQQLIQAKHDLASVDADSALAALTSKRWQALLSSDAVSRQTADEKAGQATAKKALVEAAQANVDRLEALEGFKKITAPFDGVVTARQTDIGALINAGSGSGVELFKVADTHQMRVYVRVPQADSDQLIPGMVVKLHLPQYPNEVFDAKLSTTSNAVAKESRTVLVELIADNKDGKLWPGTFAEAHFELPPDPNAFRLPTSALLFRQHGLEVATIGAGDKIALKPITIGRDLGTEVEVRTGLTPEDEVVDSPSDSLADGDRVQLAETGQPTANSPQTASRTLQASPEE
ncbi:MAG TPA: efflux RND transporter periplasmic adaptor subunit [Aliidongia sp.]|nr:efflux RND transporter periplasmic adaptor subunit [Aliidongia sp.]